MFNFTPWFPQLAYLPDRRRENMADDNARSTVSEHSREPRDGGTSGLDEMTKDRKKNKTRGGMLGWLKLKVSSTFPHCCIKMHWWNWYTMWTDIKNDPQNHILHANCFRFASANMIHNLLNTRLIICMLQKSDGVAGTLLTDGNQNSTNGSASSSSKCAQTKSTRRDKAATNKSFPERTVAEDLFSAAVGSGDPSLVRWYCFTNFLLLLWLYMAFPRFLKVVIL